MKLTLHHISVSDINFDSDRLVPDAQSVPVYSSGETPYFSRPTCATSPRQYVRATTLFEDQGHIDSSLKPSRTL